MHSYQDKNRFQAECLTDADCIPFVNHATIAQNAEKPDRTIPKKHSLHE